MHSARSVMAPAPLPRPNGGPVTWIPRSSLSRSAGPRPRPGQIHALGAPPEGGGPHGRAPRATVAHRRRRREVMTSRCSRRATRHRVRPLAAGRPAPASETSCRAGSRTPDRSAASAAGYPKNTPRILNRPLNRGHVLGRSCLVSWVRKRSVPGPCAPGRGAGGRVCRWRQQFRLAGGRVQTLTEVIPKKMIHN